MSDQDQKPAEPQLDDVLTSNDDADFDAYLNQFDGIEEDEDHDKQEQAKQKQEPSEDQPTDTKSNETDVADTDPSSALEGEVKPQEIEVTGVSSKNGEHVLPYNVLAKARSGEAQARAQGEDTARQLTQAQDQIKSFEQQLSDAGITPRLTGNQLLSDPNALKELAEEYPGIGDAILAMNERSQQAITQQQAVEEPQEANTDITDELERVPALKSWFESNPDKWGHAQQVDSLLTKDPAYASKTTHERFVEVARRVNAMYGEVDTPAPQPKPITSTQAPIQALTAPIPSSPTEVGQQASEPSIEDKLSTGDIEASMSQIDSLSDAEFERLILG